MRWCDVSAECFQLRVYLRSHQLFTGLLCETERRTSTTVVFHVGELPVTSVNVGMLHKWGQMRITYPNTHPITIANTHKERKRAMVAVLLALAVSCAFMCDVSGAEGRALHTTVINHCNPRTKHSHYGRRGNGTQLDRCFVLRNHHWHNCCHHQEILGSCKACWLVHSYDCFVLIF